MTRDYLIEQLAAKAGVTKSQADAMVRAFTDVVTTALSKGDTVGLSGFGTFQTSKRGARQGINPRTREKIQIPAMSVPKFKAGKGLKDAVR